MKIYLIDPNKKWCKANLHCHSTNSDGYYSPSELKKIYQEHGYQIVAFTDHEIIFDSTYLTDDNFVAITGTEFSINDHEVPANTTYCGNEKPKWRDLKVVHLNLFAKDSHNIYHVNTNYEDINDKSKKLYEGKEFKCDGGNRRKFSQETIQDTIDKANKAGFLVQFNHPNWSLNTREDYINLKGLWALEILNYGTEIETGAEYCPNIYDDMLRSGTRLVATMGDDNHNFYGNYDDSFGGFNYIGVDSLTYSNVLSAMEEGNIYASNGPMIKQIYIDTDDGKIYIETTPATDIILTGYNRIFRHYHGEDLTFKDFKIFGDEFYFRFTVKDKNGRVAVTRAYYLSDYGYKSE